MLALLAPVALAVRGTLDPALLLLPVVLVALFCFVLGLSLLVVASCTRYFRDVEPMLGAALLPWFFLTPIFLRLERLPRPTSAARGDLLSGATRSRRSSTRVRDVALRRRRADAARRSLYVRRRRRCSRWALGRALFRRLERELAVVL